MEATYPAYPADAGELAQENGPRLGLDSQLRFRPLAITPEGDGFIVGDPVTAAFLAVPEIGVVALRKLQAGKTIGETATAVSLAAGEDVDVLDFAAILIESGLVIAVDNQVLASAETRLLDHSWLDKVPPEWVQPFFSRFAWALYGLLLLFCGAVFVVRPQFWPTYEDFFFYPDPAICVLAGAAVNLLLTAGHEIWHWLAGRAAGVGARFSVSRRMFVPVFETDLTQLWAVPRSRRYSPFLAGMAFDTLALSLCVGLRLLWSSGAIDLDPLVYRFLGALALSRVLMLGWQGMVFLRTDLYAVLMTALGCFNLYRVHMLYLKSKLWHLRPAESAELAAAHPRDRQVAPWFSILSVAGVAWMIYTFVVFFIPSTVVMAGWMFGNLRGLRFGSLSFWEALTIGSLAAIQAIAPLAIVLWQGVQQRRRQAL